MKDCYWWIKSGHYNEHVNKTVYRLFNVNKAGPKYYGQIYTRNKITNMINVLVYSLTKQKYTSLEDIIAMHRKWVSQK